MESLGRRRFLYGAGAGLGGLALRSLLAQEQAALVPHRAAKARACIWLMMEGGPSHIDTFDPKPKLADLHLKTFQRKGSDASAMESGRRYYVKSPFRFVRTGLSGAEMAEPWERLRGVADEICFYRGCQAESVDHPSAMYHMNTGNRAPGDPSVGAWVTYGLGSANRSLPAFVVLPELGNPQGGTSNWGSGFLPPRYRGTPLRPEGSPILDLHPPAETSVEDQRANLDLLASIERRMSDSYPRAEELNSRIESYELAFRMQSEVPSLLDLRGESGATLARYGVGREPTDAFGRKCLLARRLVERGVRFVQLYHGSWDSHRSIERAHGRLVASVDRPIAALIADLRDRGLLEETLVVWGGEFGRSPDNGLVDGSNYGRDHNPRAMSVWLAGGGVRAGHTVGATDERGAEATDCVHPIRDLHVTLLHLLGLDDRRLTYFQGGRARQLSQFGGEVIRELLA